MPIYCFEHCESGEPVELVMDFAEHTERVHEDLLVLSDDELADIAVLKDMPLGEITDEARLCHRDIGADFQKRAWRGGCATWPMASEALGVMQGQQEEAYDQSVHLGVPTHFDSEGNAELRDRDHRRRLMEATGHFDKDGGYGDVQPKYATSLGRKR